MRNRVACVALTLAVAFVCGCTTRKADDFESSRILTHLQYPPESFPTLSHAMAAGCDAVPLKGNGSNTCILKWLSGQDLNIALYDMNESGEYIRNECYRIPAWHWVASVKYRDHFQGAGLPEKRLMEVRFRPWKGTGYYHDFVMIFGWNKDRFDIALLETCNWMENNYRWNQKVTLTLDGSAWGWLSLQWLYSGKCDSAEGTVHMDFNAHGSWEEELFWDEESFSFYDSVSETVAAKSGSPIRSRAAEARLAFLKKRPTLATLEKDLEDNPAYGNVPYGFWTANREATP